PQIGVVEIWIGVLIELSFSSVIGLEFDAQTIVIGEAIFWRVYRLLARKRARQFVHVFEFSQRLPASITRAPVKPRGEPHRKSLGEILIGMALCIPVVEIDDVATAEWTRPVRVRGLGP